jgi:hypothetical protein
MEKNDRYSTVILKNTGDATGDFTMDLIDMKMQENGAVVPYGAGERPQYSALPYVHVAPRSMTLKPGQTQNIRLILTKSVNMEPGEYRTHLQVRLVHGNVDTSGSAPGKNIGISVQTNLVIAIPVIVRNGETTLSMGIDQPKLVHDAKGNPSVEMYLTRAGNRSAMGDITVTWSPPGGAPPRVIKFYPGMAVYRPLARRSLSVPLDETPRGVDLFKGKLGLVYAAQKNEGGKKLAETQLSLQ